MLPLVRLQRGDLLAEVPQQPLGELDVGLPVGLAAELLGLGRVFVVVVRLKDVVVVVLVFVVFFVPFLFPFFRSASWSPRGLSFCFFCCGALLLSLFCFARGFGFGWGCWEERVSRLSRFFRLSNRISSSSLRSNLSHPLSHNQPTFETGDVSLELFSGRRRRFHGLKTERREGREG